MTELEKETIVACIGAAFSGVPGILLFWWTWHRDQEHLTLIKVINHCSTLDGESVIEKDELGIPYIDILIRNRSLFPVRVSAVGFQIDKTVVELEDPDWQVRLKRDPAPDTLQREISDDRDTRELHPGQSARITMSFITDITDRNNFCTAVSNACKRLKMTPKELVLSRKVKALAVLESGRKFSSLPFSILVRRAVKETIITSFRQIKHWYENKLIFI